MVKYQLSQVYIDQKKFYISWGWNVPLNSKKISKASKFWNNGARYNKTPKSADLLCSDPANLQFALWSFWSHLQLLIFKPQNLHISKISILREFLYKIPLKIITGYKKSVEFPLTHYEVPQFSSSSVSTLLLQYK